VAPGSNFCDACGFPLGRSPAPAHLDTPASYTLRHLANRIVADGPALEGQRKQVTVLFCDIANSTALAERIGAEAMHALLNRFFEAVLVEVHRYEGTVNQFLGDGFMALFGAPLAHEDHAQRAALAAVGISRALATVRLEAGLPPGMTLAVRMGLNSGGVVVGKIGDNLRMDYTAIGDTTNLAARLQQLAEPGTIAMSETTHRLIEGAVESRFVGEWAVRGKAAPQPVYRLDGTRAASRFQLSLQQGLTRLVGRERELAILEGCYRDAQRGGCRVADVIGEAGIGKSRVVYELRRRLPAAAVVLQGHCSPFGRTTAFLPFIETIRGAFAIAEGDDPAGAREKLTAGLGELALKVEETLPFLGTLVGLGVASDTLRGLDGEIVGARTREALAAWIDAQCRRAPTVLIIEDLHWIDRASEQLILRLAQSEVPMRLLVVCANRPDYRPPWAGRANVLELGLEPLSEDGCVDLVRHLLGSADVPGELARLIVETTEGNPLFAEEMLRYLLESERLARTEHGVSLRLDGHPIGMPSTLQDLIMARVDRLAEVPLHVLQVASVIGRRFPMALLHAVADAPEGLTRPLRALEEQELVFPVTGGGEDYRFKHALVQDAIYESLLRPRREELHRRVAEAIEQLHADRLGEWAEVLAYHYGQTARTVKTARYTALAGEKSLRVYSVEEAHQRFRDVLALVDATPSAFDAAFLGDVLLAWARAHYYRKDFTGLLALERYLAAVEAGGQTRALSLLLFWLGFAHIFGARPEAARPLLNRALALGEALDDRECIGYACMGLTYLYGLRVGDHPPEIVEELAARGLAVAEASGDVYLASKCLLGFWQHAVSAGRYTAARGLAERIVQLGRQSGDPRTSGMGLNALGMVAIYDERYDDVVRYAEESLAISPDPLDRLCAAANKGLALALGSRNPAGVEMVAAARHELETGGGAVLLGWFDLPFGVAMIVTGRMADGLRAIRATMERFEEWGYARGPVLGHLVLGEIYLKLALRSGSLSWSVVVRNLAFIVSTLPFAARRSRHHLEVAVRAARELGLPAIEARGLHDQALLLRAQGRVAAARDCLDQAAALAESPSLLLDRIRATRAALEAEASVGGP
jgi:class 3 adenylate cyclase